MSEVDRRILALRALLRTTTVPLVRTKAIEQLRRLEAKAVLRRPPEKAA
jgi:hypothetical protein